MFKICRFGNTEHQMVFKLEMFGVTEPTEA